MVNVNSNQNLTIVLLMLSKVVRLATMISLMMLLVMKLPLKYANTVKMVTIQIPIMVLLNAGSLMPNADNMVT